VQKVEKKEEKRKRKKRKDLLIIQRINALAESLFTALAALCDLQELPHHLGHFS